MNFLKSPLSFYRYLPALLISAMLTGHAAAQEEVEPTVVALFGDSITVGFNAGYQVTDGNGTTQGGFPTIYLNNLFAAEPKRTVIVANWGRGGTSSGFGEQVIKDTLNDNTAMYSGKKYYVLIMYGTNDANIEIDSSTTAFNVGMMITKAKESGYTPIVGNLTPRDDQLGEIQARNPKIRDTAAAFGAPLVDHYDRFWNYPGGWTNLIDPEVGSFDGVTRRLHPNNTGYFEIAQNWFDSVLAAAIEPDPLPPPIIMVPIISLLLDD
ncbi:MAG: SGNH/GDSL hydrolase family protein [Gammaproteobacteria bacterium]|nr:SGNH/GDSL hydrolase family protein [Gammaproteobacteria bacterium]